MTFITKDSGERATFSGGMVRDTEQGKTLWHKVFDGPLLRRWAELLTRGAAKYPDDEDTGQANWMKAEGPAELNRFRRSAFRHFMQWYNGEIDEDHAAAVFFNINGAEYVRDNLPRDEEWPDEIIGPGPNYPAPETEPDICDELDKYFHDGDITKPR